MTASSATPDFSDRPTRLSLFTAFLKIGCLGFGGVAPLARHVLVVERRMVSEREFADLFGVASTLPGANILNLSTMLGDRFRGPAGAIAAVAGLIGAPLVLLATIATLYAWFGGLEDVHAALSGAAAAAAGLVVGTSFKLLKDIEPDATAVFTAVGVCLASAWLRAPMMLILAVAIPVALIASRRPRGALLSVLWQLATTFALLSLLSIGGANATIPEIHRQVVELHHWVDDATFAELVAIGQTAPGPNVLIVSMIGWQMAGLAGMLISTLASVVPSCLVALSTGRLLARYQTLDAIRRLRRALAPIAVGFMLASGLVMSRSAFTGALSLAIVGIVAALLFMTRMSPLWSIAASAAIGVIGNRLHLLG